MRATTAATGYRTSANPRKAKTTPENPMIGPRPNSPVRTPTTPTATVNPRMRANGLLRSEANGLLPRSRGKWLHPYSAIEPNTSVPTTFPTRWERSLWANGAVTIPVGYT